MRTALILTTGILLLGTFTLQAGDAGKKDKFDPAKLVGKWTYVSIEKNGEKKSADDLKKESVTISKEAFNLGGEGGKFVMKYELDTKKSPVHVKLTITESPFGAGATAEGIIELKGDELKLCYSTNGGKAPKGFEAKKGDYRLTVLKRAK